MERPRIRRSRSLAGIEGNQDIQKSGIGKFTTDSTYYDDGTAKHMFELAKSSSRQVDGTPVKRLLAEEMSKEVEVKRRAPSVIAKLMGLDGLPSPQHGLRQQKRCSGSHHQKISSKGVQRDSHLSDGRSSRRSSVEHQEFRDVYEDLEASHVVNRRQSSKWSSSSKLEKPETSFIHKRFKDSDRLYAKEKLHASGKHDISELNDELVQKIIQEPDSLFVKHVNNLHLDPASSLCNHIAILKPSNSGNAKAWKPERDCVCKQDVKSHGKRKDGLLLHSRSHHPAQNSRQPSEIQSEAAGVKQSLPTRIVVLKPGKTNNVKSSVFSLDSSHAYLPERVKHMRCPSILTAESPLWEERDSTNVVGLSRLKCRDAREVAKKITRQMRENFGTSDSDEGINFTCPGVRGYAGDESSYDPYDTDSSSASDVMAVTSRKSFGRNSRGRAPSSSSTESSMIREAKKRLSERWKMSHRYQGEEICARGSTLGEMLGVRDKEKKPKNLDAKRSRDGNGDGFAYSNITAGWDGPLGISSRDGWKDGCVKNSCRSRSVPPSFGGKSLKSRERPESSASGPCLVTRETMSWRSGDKVNGNLGRKQGSSAKELTSGGKRFYSGRDKFIVNNNPSPETSCTPVKTDINPNKLEPSKEQPSPLFEPRSSMELLSDVPLALSEPRTSVEFHTDVPLACPAPRSSVELHPDDTMASSELRISMEVLPDLSSSTIESGDSSACDQDDTILQEASEIVSEEGSAAFQCPAPEPAFSESSKEADHPSPVSVLEVAFTEDTSSGPECFKRVSAELQGLRMQLQLLKMDSGGDADVSVSVPFDEDALLQIEDGHMLGAERWEEFYIVDILLESGIEEPDPDMLTAWQSLDCPLSTSIFDKLEKKYSDGEAGLRSERRLLFDCINSALQEIFRQYVDTCPWVKPGKRRVDSKWQKQGPGQKHRLKDALYKLLEEMENSASEATAEKWLDREMEWSGYRDGVDTIGKEIEKLLIKDLIMEAVVV